MNDGIRGEFEKRFVEEFGAAHKYVVTQKAALWAARWMAERIEKRLKGKFSYAQSRSHSKELFSDEAITEVRSLAASLEERA